MRPHKAGISANLDYPTPRPPPARDSRTPPQRTTSHRRTPHIREVAPFTVPGAQRSRSSVQDDRRRARLAFADRQPAPPPGRRPWRPPARRRPPACARAADSALPQDTSSSTPEGRGVRRHRRHIRVGGRCGRRPWRCRRRSGRGHRRRERVRQRRQRLRRVRGRHGRAPFARPVRRPRRAPTQCVGDGQGSRRARAARRRVFEEAATSSRPPPRGPGELVAGCVLGPAQRGSVAPPVRLSTVLGCSADLPGQLRWSRPVWQARRAA
jgi:hypothetical protein